MLQWKGSLQHLIKSRWLTQLRFNNSVPDPVHLGHLSVVTEDCCPLPKTLRSISEQPSIEGEERQMAPNRRAEMKKLTKARKKQLGDESRSSTNNDDLVMVRVTSRATERNTRCGCMMMTAKPVKPTMMHQHQGEHRGACWRRVWEHQEPATEASSIRQRIVLTMNKPKELQWFGAGFDRK